MREIVRKCKIGRCKCFVKSASELIIVSWFILNRAMFIICSHYNWKMVGGKVGTFLFGATQRRMHVSPLPPDCAAGLGATLQLISVRLIPIQMTLDDGRRTTDDGRRTTDDGRRTTDDGRRTTDDGRRTTDDGRRTTDDGRRTTDDGRRTTDDGRRATDDGRRRRTTGGRRTPGARRGHGTSDTGHILDTAVQPLTCSGRSARWSECPGCRHFAYGPRV